MPPPDVEVGVVRLVPLREPFINLPFRTVDKVVNALFVGGKNRRIGRMLRTLFSKHGVNENEAIELTNELLSRCDIDPKSTAIMLSMADIKALCFGYKLLCESHTLLKDRMNFSDQQIGLDEAEEALVELDFDSQSVVKVEPPKYVVQF